MLSPKELKRELERNLALKGLTETYEEVAVAKMQQIRRDVLLNRSFLEGVAEVYSISKAAYLKQLSLITNKKERAKELSVIERNSKTVAVLISGNHSLLGNIIFQTYKAYLALVGKITCDHVILGKVGVYLASSAKPKIDFREFAMDDYSANDVQIKPVVEYISHYKRILVIYPRFESVLRQTPQIDEISGGVKIEESLAAKKPYFFEPSAKEVMGYFEGQIIDTLFRQKVLEAALARYSARLTIMDQAAQAISKVVVKNLRVKTILDRRRQNKKLLSSFAGMSMWEK